MQDCPESSASFKMSFAESENVQFTNINEVHASVFRMKFHFMSSPESFVLRLRGHPYTKQESQLWFLYDHVFSGRPLGMTP